DREHPMKSAQKRSCRRKADNHSSPAPGLRLGPDGYFYRGSERVVPVGVNYWPASCGVEMWTAWPEEEIRRDLATVKSLGLNCVRFFLRWQDFEPRPGKYRAQNFRRLAKLLAWFREHDLLAQPSLFVGFMSGGHFWPEWKKDRNLFADREMIRRSTAFARRAAGVLASFHPWLAGVDYGNELDCTHDNWRAQPADVRRWCAAVSRAIRAVYPQALLVSGMSSGPFAYEGAWRFCDDHETDFLPVHPYPVPYWLGLRFDGLRDPFIHAYMPYSVRALRNFGPVMAQEFGTIITAAAAPQEAYLRSVLPAAWEAGANGFLWWCLRDIRSRAHNYVKSCMEGYLGLVDEHDRVKPGLEYFLEFARLLPERKAPDLQAEVALYWPKHYWQKEDPAHTGNEPRQVHHRMLCAWHLLALLKRKIAVVRGGEAIPIWAKTIVIPGSHLDADEQAALATWVEAGGRLIWHGPRWQEWGADATCLLGARPADFRLPRRAEIDAFGERWIFEQWHTPENCRLELIPCSAKAVACDREGFPLLWQHDLGKGRVLFALPIVEEAVLGCLSDPQARDRWARWYGGMLRMAEGE
ncbi:MAG: beta-galactosidase, partial [Planctomycetota bacterium]|nr:beta-galactosidase [Planctomycetota bacterium]